ncbi:hypothetical protein RUND412_011524 [Rhizina undulata]
MTSLEQLQATCLAILFSSQTHVVGFSRLDVKDDLSVFEKKEEQLLGLYRKLGELSLARRTLDAELACVRHEGAEDDEDKESSMEERIAKLEIEVRESRANCRMKDKVVEMTLITHPILRAVHSGATSSLKERALLPLILRRDQLSLTHANISHILSTTLASLVKTQHEIAQAQELNFQFTTRLVKLTEKKKKEVQATSRNDPRFVAAEQELKGTKMRWEVIRKVLQAVIVESGVDWSRDEKFRLLVLGCSEEDEE